MPSLCRQRLSRMPGFLSLPAGNPNLLKYADLFQGHFSYELPKVVSFLLPTKRVTCLEQNCSSTAVLLKSKSVASNGGTTERSEELWPICKIVLANSKGRSNPALLLI
jgi:hypothetical protein